MTENLKLIVNSLLFYTVVFCLAKIGLKFKCNIKHFKQDKENIMDVEEVEELEVVGKPSQPSKRKPSKVEEVYILYA